MDDSHQYNEMALLVFDRTHWIAATRRAIQPSMGYTTHTHTRTHTVKGKEKDCYAYTHTHNVQPISTAVSVNNVLYAYSCFRM